MIMVLLVIYNPILLGNLWLKWDVYDAAFPLSVAVSDALKEGQLPLWEPFVYRGVPLSHLIGVSVWSPITIVFGLIGYTQYIMQLQYVILILLAAIFMYMSLYISVKNPWLCMVGGIAYATCGQFVSNAQHLTFLVAMVLFPLLHFSFRMWVKNHQSSKSIKFSILIGVTLGLIILNNYPPFIFLSVLFILIEYVFIIKHLFSHENKLKILISHIKSALIVFFVACLFGLVSIYTTLEIVGKITREEIPWELATGASLNLWHWLGFISPVFIQLIHTARQDINLSMTNVYISLPILIFALSKRPNKKNEYFLVFIIILSVLLTMGDNGFIYRLFYELVPSMSSFRFPAGLRYLYFYYLILLAIGNIEQIYNANKIEAFNLFKRITKIFTGVFCVITIFFILIYILKINTINIPRFTLSELGITTVILLIISQLNSHVKVKAFMTIICILTIIFSFIGVFRNEEYTIGVKERPHAFKEEIKELYNNSAPVKIDNKFTVAYPNVMGYTIFTKQFQTGGYVGSFELNKFTEAYQSNKLPIENNPVIYAVDNKSVYETLDGQLDVTDESSKMAPSYIDYSPNELSIEINMENDGYVILQQTYFKGWKVKVNNENTDLKEFVGGIFGTKVNAGSNRITFEFKPINTIVTAWISFVSWILLSIYGVYLIYKRISNRK